MTQSGRTDGWRVAVVGGGLSGLAAAHRIRELCAQAGLSGELTLFEAGPRLGGTIETCRIGDYLVERATDSFITNKPWALDLCRRLDLEERLIPTDATFRRSLVLRNGRPVPVPEGFSLLAPTKIWPVLTSPIFSLGGKARLAGEYFVPRRKDQGDESVAAFVRRRFGREALERLAQPLVGGIYTSDPEKLSLQATLPRFIEMEHRYGSLIRAMRATSSAESDADESASGARYGLFATFAGGMSELIDALSERIDAAGSIRTESKVVAVEPHGAEAGDTSASGRTCWTIALADGSAETFDAVIVALPAYVAAALLERSAGGLAEDLRRIEYASSAIVVTGHALADIAHPLDAFGLVIPAVEKRKILAVSFASRKFPGRAPQGRVQLRTFIGGALQPELLDCPDDELLAIVQAELHDILGVQGEPDFAQVARYVRAMPQYHLGHLDLVERIAQRCAAHPGLELAGNAYRGVGVPDCIQSGEGAAERLVEQLRSRPADSKHVLNAALDEPRDSR